VVLGTLSLSLSLSSLLLLLLLLLTDLQAIFHFIFSWPQAPTWSREISLGSLLFFAESFQSVNIRAVGLFFHPDATS
jgi:hypothetical protein